MPLGSVLGAGTTGFVSTMTAAEGDGVGALAAEFCDWQETKGRKPAMVIMRIFIKRERERTDLSISALPKMGLKLGEVFLRVRLELGNAGFAAEFHFLSLVHHRDGVTHGSQFVIGDHTLVAGVGLHAGAGHAGHIVSRVRISRGAGT